MRRIPLLLCLLIWTLAVAPAARADRPGDLAFGWQLLRQGLHEPAQFAFAEYLENYGPDAEALYGFALSLDGQGKHEEALPRILDAEAGTNLPPNLRSALARDAAGILERAGRSDEARARYRRLAETGAAGLRPWARFREGVVLLRMRRWEEAEEAFVKMIDEAPDDTLVPDARFNLGFARYRRGDLEGAADLLTAVEATHPQSPAAVDALALLGRIHGARRECDEARREYERAIALGATLRLDGARLGEIRYQRAYLLYECGGAAASAEATAAFRAVARDAANGIHARRAAVFVGEALLDAGDFAGAREVIFPYLDEEGATFLQLLAARLAKAEGREPDALERIRRVLEDRSPEGMLVRPAATILFVDLVGKTAPGDADAALQDAVDAAQEIAVRDRLLDRWIRHRLELEDFEGADSIARRLSGGAGEELRIRWAESLQAAGRGEEAIRMLQGLQPTPHYALGYVYYRMGKSREAAEEFEAYLGEPRTPRRAEALYWLGWARYQLDDYAKAEAAFATAAEAARDAGLVEIAKASRRRAADAAFNAGAYDRAEQGYALAAASEHGSGRDEILLARAEALAQAGRIDDAIDLFLAVAWHSSDSSLAEDGLYRGAGRLTAVRRDTEAARLYDTFPLHFPLSTRQEEALYLAARAWASAGDSAAARTRYERLLADGRGDYALEAAFRIGVLLEEAGDLEGAISYYDRAGAPGEGGRRSSTVGRRAAIASGRARLVRGETDRAREIVASLREEIGAGQPLYGDLCALDGELRLVRGETRAAVALFETAVALLPPSCVLAAQKFRLGVLYLSLSDLPKARRHLEFVYRSDDMRECPERVPAGRALAEVYDRMNRRTQAAQIRQEVQGR